MNDKESNPANWSNVTILVADDNYTCYILVKEILNETKAKLIYADNGLKAVMMCRTKSIDLIIMDLRMPVLDGYSAVIQIREFLPHIPIIAVSACAMKTDIIRCKQAGFDDYLAKPIEIGVLMNKIACLLHLEKVNW
ncbi:MAG TPA: response regulator [Bacteroidales bacterium]